LNKLPFSRVRRSGRLRATVTPLGIQDELDVTAGHRGR